MAGTVSLELDPIFLKGLGYLHSKSKDSAEKLKALLDESLARGSDSTYRTSLKTEVEVAKVSVTKISKQDSKSSSSLSSSSSSSSKSNTLEKNKKEGEKRPPEKVRVEPGDGGEPAKKPRIEKQENRSSPITFSSKEIPDLTFPETSADDFAMEMGLACVICRQMTVTSGNQLVECQECHNLYHQDCHKPQVTDKDVNDPRLVWYCARCTRQMKRMQAQKTQKPPQKPGPAAVSAAPVVKDPLVKKPELKPKPDTASTFQAFKRTEVKASTATSGNSSSSGSSLPSGSGLTGWAAFTKTSTAGASSGKLGMSQAGGSKAPQPPSGAKPAGLSALAGAKPGLGGKLPGSGGGGNSGSSSGGNNNNNSNGNNGSSTVPLKPPPPLTLGKQVLSRSSSGDSLGKMTVSGSSSPGATGSGSSSGSSGGSSSGGSSGGGGNGGSGGNGAGGNGGNSNSANNNNNNGTKASADGKAPTSQESQLNAMKRLQMVKKKAAQKKLKK